MNSQSSSRKGVFPFMDKNKVKVADRKCSGIVYDHIHMAGKFGGGMAYVKARLPQHFSCDDQGETLVNWLSMKLKIFNFKFNKPIFIVDHSTADVTVHCFWFISMTFVTTGMLDGLNESLNNSTKTTPHEVLVESDPSAATEEDLALFPLDENAENWNEQTLKAMLFILPFLDLECKDSKRSLHYDAVDIFDPEFEEFYIRNRKKTDTHWLALA